MRSIKKTCLAFLIPLAFSLSSCANDTFKTTVRSVSNPAFGNVDFNVTCNDFISAGYEYDDLIDVTIKDVDGHGKDAVFNTAFVKNFNETGYFAPCLCNYEGANEYFELNFSINPTKELGEQLVGKKVVFAMKKKAGFKERRELVSVPQRLTYDDIYEETQDRDLTNRRYANFRDVTEIKGIEDKIDKGILYRGSSPFDAKDNPGDRDVVTDILLYQKIQKENLDTPMSEVSLCNVGEKLDNFMKEHKKRMDMFFYDSTTVTLYKTINETDIAKKAFCAVNLGADFFNNKVEGKDALAVGDVFKYLAARARLGKGSSRIPAYIHCNEGKDRTGFILMILEALMGVGAETIKKDFMLTFYNYYNVKEEDEEKYKALADIGAYRDLYSLLCCGEGVDPLAELSKIDWYTFDAKKSFEEKLEHDHKTLPECAEEYLINVAKVSKDDIKAIKDWLKETH
ncbi:MAG: tyrosine-protein phosphatase [Bacilli bacterium]|nr:tyrosine-protein phosphatase [Bacilli bacterium]